MKQPTEPQTVDLHCLAVVGPTHWSYRTGHPAGDLLKPGYWDNATLEQDCPWDPVVTKGDFIFVSGNNWAMLLYVLQSLGRVVVGVMNALGAVGELPPIEYPDDYVAEQGGHWA